MGATYTRQSSSEIVDAEVINASDFNDEFDQLLAAFAVSTGHTHDGTAAEGGPVTKLLGTAITIGDGTAGTDIAVTFDGETTDGVLTWMEDEDHFKFSDDVVIDSSKRLYLYDEGGEYIYGDGTDLYLTSGADINIPSSIGLTFGNDGEKIEGDGTDLTISGNNINLTATADVVIPADVGITFGSGEKIEGNSTDLTVTSGADINLTATSDVNIPSGVGVTFGDDAEKIEGDGTDLTISGNNINLTATADVVIPADVGITFGTGEKIEGNSTDLTITSGADINLTATGDVNMPADVGITFGDDGEKIEGDGTDLTISASALATVDAGTDINLDAAGGDIFFKAAGTTFGSATNTSGDLIIKSGTTTAMTFSGANVTFAGTVTIGSAGISEAELEILDGAEVTTAELNLIDGGTARGTTAVASGDGLLVNDAGTMRMTNVDTVSTYFASHNVGGSNIVTTGALDSGSITSGFGAIDNGTSGIRTDTFTAETSVIPDASGGADLGSTSAEWGDFYIADDKYINFGSDQNVLVGYDETTTDSLRIAATEGAGLAITLMADEGDDAGDEWKLNVADGGTVTLGNDINSAGTFVTHLTLTPNSTVTSSLANFAGEVQMVTLDIGGTNVTTTASELNLIDGGTSRGTTAVASGDGLLVNDAGTMRMTNVDTVSTYFASHNVGGGNIVTTGALDSGSITSGFGTIDTGSSAITTTGLISGGSLDIDNVLINGTTIGHTDDTDLLTLADASLTAKGTITVGVDDTGHDVKFFGASAGAYMEWDESADQLRIMGASADATTSTGKLLLATSLTDINGSDELGKIDFQAPHEAGGTDAIAVAASIKAVAQAQFTSSANPTDLVFYTGHSEAATEKFRFTSQGEIGIAGNNVGTDGQVLTSGGAGAAVAWEDAGGGAVTALNNATESELVTVGSTTTQLDAETNLTFDGSTLTVTGAANVSGVATATTFEPDGDTAAGDNAALGYTSVLGAILTGQGSTNDVTLVNDADATVVSIPTGTTNVDVVGNLSAAAATFDEITRMDAHPAFLVGIGTEISNITTGGEFTVAYDTEIFDQGSDFASNTFTAPRTGRYLLSASLQLDNTISAGASHQLRINTDNRYYGCQNDQNGLDTGQTSMYQITVVADMDASDTAVVLFSQASGANTSDIAVQGTYFSGCLLA